MATMTKTELESQARELAAMEVLVETNDGTYGAAEACRKVGCGDPAFAAYKVYVRVGDGRRRVVGCDPNKAPGYARHFRASLAEKQKALAALRAKIKQMAAK